MAALQQAHNKEGFGRSGNSPGEPKIRFEGEGRGMLLANRLGPCKSMGCFWEVFWVPEAAATPGDVFGAPPGASKASGNVSVVLGGLARPQVFFGEGAGDDEEPWAEDRAFASLSKIMGSVILSPWKESFARGAVPEQQTPCAQPPSSPPATCREALAKLGHI